jgi:AcrR family transcriptional regulator
VKQDTSENRELGRRERRRQETVEKLFASAMRLFSTKGYAATKVEDITEAADVGKGTFFNYFPSKRHVLGYFAGKQLSRVEHYVGVSREGDAETLELLEALARDLTRLPAKSPEMARTVVASFLGDADVREYVLAQILRGREMVAEIIARGQERGEVRRDMEAGELARIFQQSIFGTILMWSLSQKDPVERMLANSIEVLLSGLRGHDGQGRSGRGASRSGSERKQR